MNNFPLLPFLCLVFIGAQLPMRAQVAKKAAPSASAKNQAEIERIQVYESEAKYSFFMNLASQRRVGKDSPTGRWYEIKTTKNRFVLRLLSANIGIHKGKVAFISMEYLAKNSKRPDSAILLFRRDGTLAKYILIVETWNKDRLVKVAGKIQYFGANGDVLETILSSKNWITKQVTAIPDFSRPQLPAYKKISDLPFYELLKTQMRGPDGKPIV